MNNTAFYTINNNGFKTGEKPFALISETIELLQNNMDDEHLKVLDGITVKASLSEKTVMLIFHLKRDQRAKFGKYSESLKEQVPGFISSFIFYNNQHVYIFGEKFITERQGNHVFKITPETIPLPLNFTKLLKKIPEFAPRGRTRNAIILDSLSGIIPVCIHDLYNRVYCIDGNGVNTGLAKINTSANRINNCMLFTQDNFARWLGDFCENKFTPPGKKNWIGLLMAVNDSINEDCIRHILRINPETIIFYSQGTDIKEPGNPYKLTYSVTIEGYTFHKFMRRKDEDS
ncbi:MAG: hypothetical protein JXA66_05775 [Oligoflexia bacterium]|nr:hypothetical protein [Oligoflexia bacterium]